MLFRSNKVYIGVGQDPEHDEGIGHFWCIDITKKGDVSPKEDNFDPKAAVNKNSALVWHYGEPAPAAWKQNMIVVLLLYPVVFLFGAFVQTPLLSTRAGLPFAIALFIGNVASVLILNYLVPWTSHRFTWWLQPAGAKARRIEVAGTALVVALYGLLLLAFWCLF